MILLLPNVSYSAPACVFPALSRRHKGKKEFCARLPLTEFDVILCNVLFGVKKIIEKEISSILNWLRIVMDSLSCSSICDGIKQEILLTISCLFFSILWKRERIVCLGWRRECFSEGEQKASPERSLQEGWRETIYKGL